MNTDLRCVLAQKHSFPLVKDLSRFLLLGRSARVREVCFLCDLVVFLSVARSLALARSLSLSLLSLVRALARSLALALALSLSLSFLSLSVAL